MFWLLTLPFRLLFGIVFGLVALPFVVLLLPFALLLWLPFVLLRLTVKVIMLAVILPIIALFVIGALVVAGVAVFAALLLPLAPFALIALGLWLVFGHSRRTVIPA
jgi:hypothetical protein